MLVAYCCLVTVHGVIESMKVKKKKSWKHNFDRVTLKGLSQLWDSTDLDTSFFFNLKSKICLLTNFERCLLTSLLITILGYCYSWALLFWTKHASNSKMKVLKIVKWITAREKYILLTLWRKPSQLEAFFLPVSFELVKHLARHARTVSKWLPHWAVNAEWLSVFMHTCLSFCKSSCMLCSARKYPSPPTEGFWIWTLPPENSTLASYTVFLFKNFGFWNPFPPFPFPSAMRTEIEKRSFCYYGCTLFNKISWWYFLFTQLLNL